MFQVIYLILALAIALAPLIVVAFMLRGLTMMFLGQTPDDEEDEDNDKDKEKDDDKEKDKDDNEDELELPSMFNI